MFGVDLLNRAGIRNRRLELRTMPGSSTSVSICFGVKRATLSTSKSANAAR
ncbi:hypothetical protein BSIN_0971 [Burkholderia singularis]|uniref:Uncharacterized protein n=1 Tax=Burkholderia singularis TaxID=1503053 RepID=A0A238HBI2_9BURK|nr:hypothetical protein BSIN_0971 [Burkholderia singularis]